VSEIVDVVRRSNDAFNRGDVEAVIALSDPDIEVEDIPELPEAQVFRGHEGLRDLLALNWEPWEQVVVGVEHLIEVDTETVLLLSRNRWTVRESRVEIVQPRGSIFTVRGGLIVRARFYADQQLALEAAGIELESL
jgi:ketosteroid isomerase-like protein